MNQTPFRRLTGTIRRLTATITAVIGLILTAASVHAQIPPKSPQQKAMEDKIYAQIGVTPAQRTKLDALETKYRALLNPKVKQIQALQKKYGANPQGEKLNQLKKEAQPLIMQMQQISTQAQRESANIFTPAQKAKLQSMAAQRMQSRGGAPSGRPGN